jgi:hypothetical protein
MGPGANRLRIVTTPDGEAPATVTNSQDRRKLALQVQDFQVRFK